MFVVNAYDKSVAYPRKQLSSSPASVNIGGNKITAVMIDGEIIVKDTTGKILPGYHEMWFFFGQRIIKRMALFGRNNYGY